MNAPTTNDAARTRPLAMPRVRAGLVGAYMLAFADPCGGGGRDVSPTPPTADAAPAPTSSPPDAGVDAAEEAAAPDAWRKPRPGDPCTDRRECDDGILCNGVEECLAGRCASARNSACRDPGACSATSCDEARATCTSDPFGEKAAAACPAPTFCSAETGCRAAEGCTRVDDPLCDDKRACTDDLCDLPSGRCFHVPRDARCLPEIGGCGRGVCLGERVAEPSGCGGAPDARRCAANEGCDSALRCVRLPASCTRDEECQDGTLCDGRERCVAEACVRSDRPTCAARDACHHVFCRDRLLGDPYCQENALPRCRG